MIQDELVTALILTHKRGAIVAVAPSLSALLGIDPQCCSMTLETEAMVVSKGVNGVAGFSRTTTAEVLHDIWIAVTGGQQVGQLIVGVGPGSFTGLRLGCAYANGVALGNSQLRLFALTPLQYNNETELLSWVDLASALNQIRSSPNQCAPVSECIPFYGKEPGPVIKLKEQMCLKP